MMNNIQYLKEDYTRLKYEYDNLLQENKRLKKDNSDLEKSTEETIALYDITKEICKYLDADKVFSSFRQELVRYIEIDDCKFIHSGADLSAYINYTTLPLNIDKNLMGYLVVSGVKEQDRDKFNILVQQFLLGLKRAFLYQQVQELAITDSLTEVFSRRYCLERLNEEIGRSRKFKHSFSFLMSDIDHFKDYNDRYGHLVGDGILREVSGAIKTNIRQIDLIGRYGGEEFLVLLPQTDKEQARPAAERIREAIEYRSIRVYDEDLRVTVSIGISTFPDDGKDVQTLIDRADSALYQAKLEGRNRVCVYRASK